MRGGRGEEEIDRVCGGSGCFGAVGEVVHCLRDGVVCRRGCRCDGGEGGVSVWEGLCAVGWLGRTSDEQIALAPLKVAQDGVECVRRVRDEHDFVRVCSYKLRDFLPNEIKRISVPSVVYCADRSYRDLSSIARNSRRMNLSGFRSMRVARSFAAAETCSGIDP